VDKEVTHQPQQHGRLTWWPQTLYPDSVSRD